MPCQQSTPQGLVPPLWCDIAVRVCILALRSYDSTTRAYATKRRCMSSADTWRRDTVARLRFVRDCGSATRCIPVLGLESPRPYMTYNTAHVAYKGSEAQSAQTEEVLA